jgi:peptidoglycan hydrolase-like protein with peptidoglycan-binding domain
MTVLPPISKFPQVDQADAGGELAEIYDDIESTLRVPWVPFAVRVMSLFPAFVPAAWRMLKPQISTMYAEKGADLVREASVISGPPPADPRPKLRAAGRSDEQIREIRQALDSLNYGNPKGLILITAWNEAWNERAAGSPANCLPAAEARQLPYGLPGGVEKLRLIDPDRAPLDVQELLRQAKDLFLHHAPMSDYRVLAAWPDVLRIAVEDILTPVALTAGYEETARRIRAIARTRVAGFSDVGGVSRRQMRDSLSGPEIAGLTGVLFMYNRFIADITIAMIRVKQAFDGASSATENKFPVT